MEIPIKRHKDYDPLGDCGKGRCPVCARSNALFRTKSLIETENFTSDAVAPFVGRFGYPNINVGILAPPPESKDAWLYDAPNHWSLENFEIPRIVDLRSSLLNSRYNLNIKKELRCLSFHRMLQCHLRRLI